MKIRQFALLFLFIVLFACDKAQQSSLPVIENRDDILSLVINDVPGFDLEDKIFEANCDTLKAASCFSFIATYVDPNGVKYYVRWFYDFVNSNINASSFKKFMDVESDSADYVELYGSTILLDNKGNYVWFREGLVIAIGPYETGDSSMLQLLNAYIDKYPSDLVSSHGYRQP